MVKNSAAICQFAEYIVLFPLSFIPLHGLGVVKTVSSQLPSCPIPNSLSAWSGSKLNILFCFYWPVTDFCLSYISGLVPTWPVREGMYSCLSYISCLVPIGLGQTECTYLLATYLVLFLLACDRRNVLIS
jgi:hypothetical protein